MKMTREDVIRYCMTLPGAYEDYPFGDFDWCVVRHGVNKKGFAYIFERDGCVWVNVKCEPMQADFWRSVYKSVLGAYHMNKTHWNSMILDGSFPPRYGSEYDS